MVEPTAVLACTHTYVRDLNFVLQRHAQHQRLTWLVAAPIAAAAADETSGDVALPLRTLIKLWVRASANAERAQTRGR